MTNNPNQQYYHRHSIRLPDYNYSEAGSYFVTVLTHGREPLFGKVVKDEVFLSPAGKIVWDVWKSIPNKYPQIELDTAVVMPNHFHGIITINDNSDEQAISAGEPEVRAIHELPLPQTMRAPIGDRESNRKERRSMLLPLVIGYFKMQSAKQINAIRNSDGQPVWHRNYYEHIICNDKEFESISDYIEFNPTNWKTKDEYFLNNDIHKINAV